MILSSDIFSPVASNARVIRRSLATQNKRGALRKLPNLDKCAARRFEFLKALVRRTSNHQSRKGPPCRTIRGGRGYMACASTSRSEAQSELELIALSYSCAGYVAPPSFGVSLTPALYSSANILLLSFARIIL
jgi:hypothetical protein